MKQGVEIRADRKLFRGVDIHIVNESRNLHAKPVEMVRYDEGAVLLPCMTISIEQAQLLMDDLWQAGLRPSEGTGSAGALRAVENHLKDMRCIVFKNNPMAKK